MADKKDTLLIIEIIREFGDTKHAKFVGTVTAVVNGVTVISEQPIDVALTYDGTNYACIDVLWEDHGYKNYKEMCLYGRMKTQYESVIRTATREFSVIGGSYDLTVRY